MISLADYFGPWVDHPDAKSWWVDNAHLLLLRVNDLMRDAEASGVEFWINPRTKTHIAGVTLGGFRPIDAVQGAANSSHKEGSGVDIFDPHNELDRWIDDDVLTQYDLYREAPQATPRWVHLTTRPPRSGKRTFMP